MEAPLNKEPLLKRERMTANVPGALAALLPERIKHLGYHSKSDYIVGLIIFDIYCKQDHVLTAPLLKEPQWVVDAAISEIVKEFHLKDSKPRGWFAHRLQELVDEAKKKGDPDAPKG